MATSFSLFHRRRRELAEPVEPELICFRAPGWYRHDDRDPSRGGRHFAKLVTRVRPHAVYAAHFEGHYLRRGGLSSAPEGAVVLVVDTLCSAAGRARGVGVELWVLTADGLRRERAVQTGSDWGKVVRERVAELLDGRVSELDGARLQRLYGIEGSAAVGAFLDQLLELSEADWEELARLAQEGEGEVVQEAADRAYEVACERGSAREYEAARRVWRRVERQAERAVGLDELRECLEAETQQTAYARLARLREAVENGAVAALLGEKLDSGTYDLLTDPFVRLEAVPA